MLVVLCRDEDVRLVGGRTIYEGRVEICRLEEWRTVCRKGWTAIEASIVCSQLGFSRISKSSTLKEDLTRQHTFILTSDANVSTIFGPGSREIYGQQHNCTGNEQQLSECPFELDTEICISENDAGVECNTTRESKARNGWFVSCGGGEYFHLN